MPLVQTRGAASAQGFGEFAQASGPVIYIEDVFSTFLYTGNGTTQTITNNIDLSTKGGLVWQKDRTTAATDNVLCDTAQGVNYFLRSNLTNLAVTNGIGSGYSKTLIVLSSATYGLATVTTVTEFASTTSLISAVS